MPFAVQVRPAAALQLPGKQQLFALPVFLQCTPVTEAWSCTSCYRSSSCARCVAGRCALSLLPPPAHMPRRRLLTSKECCCPACLPQTWFRCWIMCMALYFGVGAIWCYYAYFALGEELCCTTMLLGGWRLLHGWQACKDATTPTLRGAAQSNSCCCLPPSCAQPACQSSPHLRPCVLQAASCSRRARSRCCPTCWSR